MTTRRPPGLMTRLRSRSEWPRRRQNSGETAAAVCIEAHCTRHRIEDRPGERDHNFRRGRPMSTSGEHVQVSASVRGSDEVGAPPEITSPPDRPCSELTAANRRPSSAARHSPSDSPGSPRRCDAVIAAFVLVAAVVPHRQSGHHGGVPRFGTSSPHQAAGDLVAQPDSRGVDVADSGA